MVTVALLGVVAAMVMAVPATAHEAPPDEHPGGGPEMSGYVIGHGPDNRPDELVAIQLDEWGHVTQRVIGYIRRSESSTPSAACAPEWACVEEDVRGLAFGPDGTLFGVQGGDLVTISTASGVTTRVGPLGETVDSGPLAFDCAGNLWTAGDPATTGNDRSSTLYSVDPDTGAATEVGQLGHPVVGLAARGDTVFGLGPHIQGGRPGWFGPRDADLLTIDTSTGAATQVGPLTNASVTRGALAFAPDGTLWGVGTDPTESPWRELLLTVDADSGTATVLAESGSDYRDLAIRGGPACGEGVSAAAGGSTTPDAGSQGGVLQSGGEASEPVQDPAESRQDNGRAGSLPSSDRSENGTTADHAPTAGGDGTAVEPDDHALTATGRLSEEPATAGWPTARIAALVLAVLAVIGTGWRRLTRSRS